MLGAKLTFLAMGVVMGAMGDSPRLRVARHLQWNGDSNDKVVPQCKAGYNDVSGGSAFYWSCAFHCEGGPYYATEGCICACLTPEQETAWRGMVTTLPASPFSPVDETPRAPGEILVTPPPATTRRPVVPVSEIPVGEIDSDPASGDSPSGGASPGDASGSGGFGALPSGFSLATPTAAPKAQVIHNKALDMNVVVIAVIAAAGIAGVTFFFVICFNCRSLVSIFRKSDRNVEKPKFATAPVLRLHADVDGASNSPCCDVEAPSSRASSKVSTNSGTSGHISSSRRSSKASTGSYQPQKDTSSLLKLPRNDGLEVANSVESLSSWAREHRPSLQPPSAFPGRGRSSSRTSAGSQMSQEQTLQAPRGRSSSRTSAVSQDSRGTQSISSMVVAAGSKRKMSKVQPVAVQ